MTKQFSPSLAEDSTPERIEQILKEDGAVYASFKLDGIRGLVRGGRLVSRSLLPIPNLNTRNILSRPEYEGYDGELICGAPCGEGVYSRSFSAFMTQVGEYDFYYHVFDLHNLPYVPYASRLRELSAQTIGQESRIKLVKQYDLQTMDEINSLEAEALQLGYEGLIVRRIFSPYKHGRSTLKQGYMLKVKRFLDSEARIIGFEERMKNENAAYIDDRGLQKRGSSQAGLKPTGMLGAFLTEDIHHPEWHPRIGSGFDHEFARQVWADKPSYLNRIIKYKYLPIGMVDEPRHPIFLGLRDKEDMS